MNIVSPYPLWYFIICFLLAATAAFLLYRKDRKLTEFSKITVGILFTLRFFCLGLLAALLLSPLVKYVSKTVEAPVIIIAQDNSSSLLMGKDSAFIKKEFAQNLNQLKADLEKDFEVTQYQFADGVSEGNNVLSYTGNLTDFDVLFDELQDRYANRNVGGLILISDGIYNSGSNPSSIASNLEFPVFSIPLGDTTRYVDAKIENLRANKLAFLGNEFPVEFDLKVQKAKMGATNVTIYRGQQVIFQKKININSAQQTIQVAANLKATQIGKQKYVVKVDEFENERNVLNNSQSFYIDVLDGRQKVALLGVSPHPDLKAIKQGIVANENYELYTGLLEDFTKKFDDYDLVILHQAAVLSKLPATAKLRELIAAKVPVLLIGGGWGSIEFQLGIRNSNKGAQFNNEAQPLINEQFTLFSVEENVRKKIQNFPPLSVSDGNTSEGNSATTLLYQKRGNVSTRFPLLSFFEEKGRKTGRLYGEGFWRWRMNDFVEHKNHELSDRFIAKIIQYLAVKADRSFFRVSTNDEYYENDNVQFDAQLFNPSYELVNDAEVTLKITGESGKEFDYTFNRRGNGYGVNLKSLPAGSYRYQSETTYQGRQQKVNGAFTIKELQLEKMNSEANHNVLYQIAERSGGELIAATEMNTLAERIRNRKDIASISYLDEEVQDIINLKWIFFVLLALLSIEWFVRKRGGAY